MTLRLRGGPARLHRLHRPAPAARRRRRRAMPAPRPIADPRFRAADRRGIRVGSRSRCRCSRRARRSRWRARPRRSRAFAPAWTASTSSTAGRRATFLPQVWESLPDPVDFLAALRAQGAAARALLGPGDPPSRYTVEKFGDGTSATEPRRGRAPPRALVAPLDDGRIQCDLCPRDCRLHEGQRGRLLRARARSATRWCSRRTGARPGSASIRSRRSRSTISIPGTARAFLRHRRLQPRVQVLPELGHLEVARHGPADGHAPRPRRSRARRARRGARSVAFTYNDPVIFAEYAMDVGRRLPRRAASHTVAVTAGYMHARAAPRVLRAGWTRPTST